MRSIILILVAVAVGLGVLASQQAAAIKEQRVQIVADSERLTAASLANQAKCSQQAKMLFDEAGYKAKDMATYQNHFSIRLQKCFVNIQSRMATGGTFWENRNTFDAYENRDIGTYVWRSQEGSSFKDVPPMVCTVKLPAGDEQKCKSGEDFDKLTAAYMAG